MFIIAVSSVLGIKLKVLLIQLNVINFCQLLIFVFKIIVSKKLWLTKKFHDPPKTKEVAV